MICSKIYSLQRYDYMVAFSWSSGQKLLSFSKYDTEYCAMHKTKQSCLWAVITLISLMCSSCINRDLRFIKTEYDFEHMAKYHQPEQYFSKDTISFNDYQNIVCQYTEKFGPPIHSGVKKEAMKIYNDGGSQYDDVPHRIWGYATDGEYYTIYNQGTDYLLIIFSSYCGIYVFE